LWFCGKNSGALEHALVHVRNSAPRIGKGFGIKVESPENYLRRDASMSATPGAAAYCQHRFEKLQGPSALRKTRRVKTRPSVVSPGTLERSVNLSELPGDFELLQRATNGQTCAQEELFSTYTPRLYRAAFRVLRNKEDAEDAVQNAWCKAFANLHTFQGHSSLSTWLTRIDINSALMNRRKNIARAAISLEEHLGEEHGGFPREPVDPQPNPEEIFAAIEMNNCVEEKVQQLSPALQAAFHLRVAEECSIKESTEVLRIQESAFKSRVLRMRRHLAATLQSSFQLSARGRSASKGRTRMA
jgi:RNA polymerase sigma-70 factor, ECF subfamily